MDRSFYVTYLNKDTDTQDAYLTNIFLEAMPRTSIFDGIATPNTPKIPLLAQNTFLEQ